MSNPVLKAHIMEAVNNQLRDNNPKATKETLDRLIELGYDDEKAKEMIASVFIEEMYAVLKNEESYNEERYTKKLLMLPEHNSESESTEDLTVRKDKATGRNEPCTCGSGKKYKKCCGK